MDTQRRLIRPDFESETRGFWAGEWLTAPEAKALINQLPSTMTADARVIFMTGVDRALNDCSWLKRTTSEGKQQRQLQAVAKHARKLLQSMADSKLHPDTRSAIRAVRIPIALGLPGTIPLSEATERATAKCGFMPHFWDTVQDIEAVFLYAAEQAQPSKQARPSISNERALAGEIAKAHFQATGEWPYCPESSKKSWFLEFVEALPKRLGVALGGDTVRTEIEDLKGKT